MQMRPDHGDEHAQRLGPVVKFGRLSPQQTAQLDQRLGQLNEALDEAVVEHCINRKAVGGNEVAAIKLTGKQMYDSAHANGDEGLNVVLELLVTALSRLAGTPNLDAVVDELSQQADAAQVLANDARLEIVAMQHTAEARAYRDAARLIKAASG